MFKLDRLGILTLSCVALLATSCAELTSTVEEPNTQTSDTAEVVRHVDGDTVWLDIDGTEESVRLIGIDTPEVREGSEPIQCFGQEASDAIAELLPLGTVVQIQRDAEVRDRFDRLLLYIFVGDTFVNEELVRQGFADSRSFPPNTARQSLLDEAERDAIDNNRGLWAACDGPAQPLN